MQCYFSDKYGATYQKLFKGQAMFWNSPAILCFLINGYCALWFGGWGEWSALFLPVCILGQHIRFFRVKEQQTIDWTLGENVTYVIPNSFCNGGFSYNSFGRNSYYFESKRSHYAMNSSGFNFGGYGAASSFMFICTAVSC